MPLELFIGSARARLSARRQRLPEAALRQELSPSDRSLERSLRRRRIGFVLECKKASPSRGLIRREFDPRAIAAAYAPYADGISVLTDERFFAGRHAYLREARLSANVPVLCKDFVVDPYQVIEARYFGADAVLLILAALDDGRFAECAAAAESVGLDVLAEVHDERELERALALGARIIGINNRDLETLEVRLETTERLAPLVPADRVVVAESGIGTRADVVRLRPLVDAFLIGTALMSRPDLSVAVREIVHGRVKICGLTNAGDARAAARAGATHGGLVFAPGSPRRVDLARAAQLRHAVDLAWVGVFVDERAAQVAALARQLRLSAVQLHGDESLAYVRELRALLPAGCEVWKAIRVHHAIPELAATGADRLLLDAHHRGARGGTGRRFDWDLLAGRDLSRVVLAGGLNPRNVVEAAALGAPLLDVSSGVERAPGVKCPALIEELMAALRGSGRKG
jgi:indole-3-glycerol phosphate synthase/phosphoribosylanthranilate isomerase